MSHTYVGAEVLQGETLDGVDAQMGVGLNDGETTGDWIKGEMRQYASNCALCGHSDGSINTGWVGTVGRTEELLGGTALLDDLDETGLELLNGGNVVGEDTHLTGLGGDVDLDTGLKRRVSMGWASRGGTTVAAFCGWGDEGRKARTRQWT